MRLAIVGCGFVADYYLKTLTAYPSLSLAGVFDRDHGRSALLAQRYRIRQLPDLDAILGDPAVDALLNLTNPSSHYEISRAALSAGKHVYSEKPLAMELGQARELVKMASQAGLQISSAPCSILGETAQTTWRALRERRVGRVRLVYAEMDDGMVHRMAYRRWASASGIPWPWKDEFEVGCTLEHAGYYLTWLTAFFGAAETVTAFSSCLVSDKETSIPLERQAPDYSTASIRFASGLVARLTCSIVAPHDHSLTVVGDEGILGVDDSWYYDSPVWVRRTMTLRRKTFLSPWKVRVRPVRKARRFGYRGAQQMDFARGVAELAEAVAESRRSRLPADYSLHNTELALAIHGAGEAGSTYHMRTTFEPVEPAAWAI
jgi:predicted dehydrogenase